MVTDPASTQQLMRPDVSQGATLKSVAQERYQTGCGSLDKSFKAIAQAATEARRALPAPAAAPRAVETSDVRVVPKAPAIKQPCPAGDGAPKPGIKDDNFDTDYSPSRNGKL